MEYWTFETIQARLVEAMVNLWRTPGLIGPDVGGTMALWRQVTRDAEDAPVDEEPRRTGLSRREMREMDEALGWVDQHVPAGDTRKIVSLAIGQLARGESRVKWTEVHRRMTLKGAAGFTTDALRVRYSRAITMICAALNRMPVPETRRNLA